MFNSYVIFVSFVRKSWSSASPFSPWPSFAGFAQIAANGKLIKSHRPAQPGSLLRSIDLVNLVIC